MIGEYLLRRIYIVKFNSAAPAAAAAGSAALAPARASAAVVRASAAAAAAFAARSRASARYPRCPAIPVIYGDKFTGNLIADERRIFGEKSVKNL